MTSVPHPHCPLCSTEAEHYHRDKRRTYLQCNGCRLVFVPCEFFPSQDEERAVYDLHQNGPEDAGYRRFLSRSSVPVIERIPRGAHGLDFGCGPGPTLSVMFEEQGYAMAVYDPLFAADESVLTVDYDFVTATEVVEHFQRPRESLEAMWRCVKPGGVLGLMTKLVIDREAFSSWHYTHDETHVCFYSRETFEWLAQQWQTEPTFVGNDVIILQKPSND
jgi:SAM-dependent methyltransferase